MRRSEMRRKTPLARGAQGLARSAPLRQSKPKRREKIPANVRARVYKRSRGKCIVCQRRVTLTVHHVLPVREWPGLTTEEANMVGVCAKCHMNHEAAHRRIRWEELPSCAVTLAHATSGAAVVFMERTYPRRPCPPFDAAD